MDSASYNKINSENHYYFKIKSWNQQKKILDDLIDINLGQVFVCVQN